MTYIHTLPPRAPAITIWQPWASAMIPVPSIAYPLKQHETRGRAAPADWIGKLVCIHAAAKRNPTNPDNEVNSYGSAVVELMRMQWGLDWADSIPHGAVLGVGTLLKCFHIAGRWQAASDSDAVMGN